MLLVVAVPRRARLPERLLPPAKGDSTRLDPMTLPYLTADLPGVGGTVKTWPGDFVVEEIPAYAPCGEGEHLFLWVEKEDVAADVLVRHLSSALGVPRDVYLAFHRQQDIPRPVCICTLKLEKIKAQWIP